MMEWSSAFSLPIPGFQLGGMLPARRHLGHPGNAQDKVKCFWGVAGVQDPEASGSTNSYLCPGLLCGDHGDRD